MHAASVQGGADTRPPQGLQNTIGHGNTQTKLAKLVGIHKYYKEFGTQLADTETSYCESYTTHTDKVSGQRDPQTYRIYPAASAPCRILMARRPFMGMAENCRHQHAGRSPQGLDLDGTHTLQEDHRHQHASCKCHQPHCGGHGRPLLRQQVSQHPPCDCWLEEVGGWLQESCHHLQDSNLLSELSVVSCRRLGLISGLACGLSSWQQCLWWRAQ